MQSKEMPLVTVAVLVYKNFQYIWDCVESILEQDYPKIRLVVSDDGSENFDAEELERFIRRNRRKNLRSVFLHQMERNVGTSKNFNFALSHAEGEYVKFIAADDLFYDVDSLSKLVAVAEQESGSVVIARAPSYDRYLERREWTYPSDEHWAWMRDAAGNPKEFFGIMSPYCLISSPAALYRLAFLKARGGADEQYRLIEDWPFWMRMLRDGERFTFLDEPVVIYRSGGVSNGIENANYAAYQLEHADVIRRECLAHPEAMATKAQYLAAKRSEREHRFHGERGRLRQNGGLFSKAAFYLRYADFYGKKLLSRLKALFWRLNQWKRKLLLFGLLLLAVFSITDTAALLGVFHAGTRELALFLTRFGLGCGAASLLAGGLLYAGAIPVTFFSTIKYSGE